MPACSRSTLNCAAFFFKSDLGDQGQRLLAMLGQAVALLDRPERLLPVLRQLGARHQGYGVQASHYTTVGQALLDTLAAGLGPAFNPRRCARSGRRCTAWWHRPCRPVHGKPCPPNIPAL
ncbi:MAG: globin domain-containing protein [Inhella sp.]